jgi:hypothetical protein
VVREAHPTSFELELKRSAIKKIPLVILLLVSVFAAELCFAGVNQEVRFSPGSKATVIEQSVIRGEQDLYYLTARAGQTMVVSLAALENNAVFAIYQPGFKVTSDQEGFREIKGASLPKAGESDDATAWEGPLPISGKYLIVVGGTRGNATYKLTIAIR